MKISLATAVRVVVWVQRIRDWVRWKKIAGEGKNFYPKYRLAIEDITHQDAWHEQGEYPDPVPVHESRFFSEIEAYLPTICFPGKCYKAWFFGDNLGYYNSINTEAGALISWYNAYSADSIRPNPPRISTPLHTVEDGMRADRDTDQLPETHGQGNTSGSRDTDCDQKAASGSGCAARSAGCLDAWSK